MFSMQNGFGSPYVCWGVQAVSSSIYREQNSRI